MRRKPSTRLLFVFVGLAILVYVAAGYFLLVSPKKSEAARLDDEIAATNVELITARAALDEQDDTEPIAVADIFRLSKAMPGSPDMPGILLELSRIAEETGIRFKSITPQAAVPAGEYQTVPIAVTFDGTFYALSDFLFRLRTLVSVRRGELHASGRLFSVESVDFAEGEAGFPTLAAALKIQAFVYGTDSTGTQVPTPAAAPPAAGAGPETPAPAEEPAAEGATG